MSQSQFAIDQSGIMNRCNQSVAVMPNVEYDVSIHIVRIRKCRPQFVKAPPSGRLRNAYPCRDLTCGVSVLLARLLKTLDGDDMHNVSILRKLRSINAGVQRLGGIKVEKRVESAPEAA